MAQVTALPSSTNTEAPVAKGRGVGHFVWTFARRNKEGAAGFIILALIVGLSLIGPLLMGGKNLTDVTNIWGAPTWKHPLGGDYAGKDVWYEIVHGGRTLLFVSVLAALLTTIIGVVLGSISAMLGGAVDAVILVIADVVLTVPSVILLAVLAAYIQLDSALLLAVVLAATAWPALLRAVRSQVLSLKEREYVEAARMLDLGTPRILFREVIPNMMSYIVINFVFAMTGAIYGQVVLFFLGLVPLAGNNWGLMINEAYTKGALFYRDSVLYILAPIFMVVVLQLSLVMISRSLEDVFNPRLREE